MRYHVPRTIPRCATAARCRGSTATRRDATGRPRCGVFGRRRHGNLDLFIPAGSAVTFGVDYRMVNALSGIDIGGPGFSPSRFPGLEEDAHIVGGCLLANVTDTVNLNVFFVQVVAGNNTVSRIFGAGIGFGFGGGGFDFWLYCGLPMS